MACRRCVILSTPEGGPLAQQRTWTTRRDEKRRRLRLVEPWMHGPILPRERIIPALENPDRPSADTVARVAAELDAAIIDARRGPVDLGKRLPLLPAVYGDPAAVSAVIAIAVGAVTISPLTLAILENNTGHHDQLHLAFFQAIKRPVVWAPVLAVLWVALDFAVPTYVERARGHDLGAAETDLRQ